MEPPDRLQGVAHQQQSGSIQANSQFCGSQWPAVVSCAFKNPVLCILEDGTNDFP